jgi:hypothetical protein
MPDLATDQNLSSVPDPNVNLAPAYTPGSDVSSATGQTMDTSQIPPAKPGLWKGVLTGALQGLALGGLPGAVAGAIQPSAPAREIQHRRGMQQAQEQEAQSNIKFRDAQAAHMAASDTNALQQLELQTQESNDRHEQMSQASADWLLQHGATLLGETDNTHEALNAAAEGISKDHNGIPATKNLLVGGKVLHFDLSTFSGTPQGLESVNQFLAMTNQKPLTPQQWQTTPPGVRNQKAKDAIDFMVPTDAFSSAAAASGAYQQSKSYLDALTRNQNTDPAAVKALTQRTALLKQQADGMAADEAARKKSEQRPLAPKAEKPQELVTGSMPDGRVVAGTLDELKAAGVTNATKLGATESSKALIARQLTSPNGLISNAEKDLAAFRPEELNAIAARWNEFATGTLGSGDPRYVALRTDTQLLSTALMQAHVGSRGSEAIMEHFKNMANAGKMNGETLRAAIATERRYVEEKAMRVSGQSTAAPHKHSDLGFVPQ